MTQSTPDFAQAARRFAFPAAHWLVCLIIGYCVASGYSAAAQSSVSNETHCADPGASPSLRIRACTALIHSGHMNPNDLATAYNDRGNGYQDDGDRDAAIRDYAEAIRLKPNYALAFYNRGNVYGGMGEYDQAIQDYNQAIRLEPDNSDSFYAFYGRGYAYSCKGEYGRAIRNYDRAIRLQPDNANTFFVRGVANYLQGHFAGAVSDLQHVRELNPLFAYDVLWLHLARMRLGQDDSKDLSEQLEKPDASHWPGPILSFYAGRLTIDQIIAAAGADPDHQLNRLCEANFFAGEGAFVQKRYSAAKALLQAALNGCPKANFHFVAAETELRRLDSTAPSGRRRAPAHEAIRP